MVSGEVREERRRGRKSSEERQELQGRSTDKWTSLFSIAHAPVEARPPTTPPSTVK